MAFTPPKSKYELHPVGMFAAVCYQVIDLGSHLDQRYGNCPRKIKLSFETTKKMKDGRPFSVQTRFNYTMGKNAVLRENLEMWRSRPFTADEIKTFDLFTVLGKCAMLNIQHSEDGAFANVASINPLPGGMQKPSPVNPLLKFFIDEFDQSAFDKLSEKDREFINASDERNPGQAEDREAMAATKDEQYNRAPQGDNQSYTPPAYSGVVAPPSRANDPAPEFNDDDIPF